MILHRDGTIHCTRDGTELHCILSTFIHSTPLQCTVLYFNLGGRFVLKSDFRISIEALEEPFFIPPKCLKWHVFSHFGGKLWHFWYRYQSSKNRGGFVPWTHLFPSLSFSEYFPLSSARRVIVHITNYCINYGTSASVARQLEISHKSLLKLSGCK